MPKKSFGKWYTEIEMPSEWEIYTPASCICNEYASTAAQLRRDVYYD